MSDDLAMDSQVGQAPEAGLPETWREHVRELRSENARRRKENQELRTQFSAVSDRLREAEGAQTAAAERSSHDAARLAAVHRRLKEAEIARLAREAVRDAAARRQCGAGVPPASSAAGKMPAPPPPADGGRAGSPGGSAIVDLARATRLLERVGLPVDIDRDLSVDDEGRVGLAPEAGERLRSFVEELVDLVAVETRVAPPPVGGEPPRTAEGGLGPIVNAWDPEGQTSAAGKARASLRQTAAQNAVVLDGLTQI